MVRRIENASDYALVLFDEPEVSLHPEDQENLKEHLLDVIKKKKLQVIISLHSPVLINGLLNSVIKLFKMNEKGKFYIEENVHYQEAFHDKEE